MNRVEHYQDLYRKAWEAQNAIDEKNRLARETSKLYKFRSAPRRLVIEQPQLTAEETMINNGVSMGLQTGQIAKLIGKSPTTVRRKIQALRLMGVLRKSGQGS